MCKIFVVLLYLLILLDNAWAAPITAQDARNVVTGWLNLDSSPLNTSLGSQIQKVERHNDSRGQPLYYIVRLQPSGVVIVSGDDLVEPIIAFLSGDDFEASDKHPIGAMANKDLPKRIKEACNIESSLKAGLLSPDLQKAIEARSKWILLLNCSQAVKAAEYLKSIGSGGCLGKSSLMYMDDVRVEPLVQSKWDQGNECYDACYNWYTPRVLDSNVVWDEGNSNNFVCGCGPTAIAQIIRYHEYPTAGIGVIDKNIYVKKGSVTERILRQTRGGDGSGGPYQWSNMPLDPGCSTTETQRKAIGALCYDIGVCCGVTYSASGTSISFLSPVYFTNYFKYTYAKTGSTKYFFHDINTNIDALHPVTYSRDEHTHVIDGYGYDNGTMYHHINYGWGGSNDAWYNLSAWGFYVCNIFTSGTGDIISGRIIDMQTKQPINEVTVTATAPGAYYQAVTDDKGIYALAKIEVQQEYTISATKTGYIFADQVVNTDIQGRTLGNLWGIDLVGLFCDFNSDQRVNIDDLVILIEHWDSDDPLCDIYPMPWGDGIVDKGDLQVFMTHWGIDCTLIAHYKLDEIGGDIAYDSASLNDALVIGEPVWQPIQGYMDGSIELDGIDDYISTPFILNPKETSAFSVFAWIKGGLPGQTIISQANGADWLSADILDGTLKTELKGGGRSGSKLVSQTVITDDDWHRVGITWDDINKIRALYVDDVIAAIDTQGALPSSEGGLYIGTGNALDVGTYWTGLIDDVRIYDRAITP